jgi:DNA-binding NarL/FixJ family response regulator
VNIESLLPEVRVPTLVIHGRDDGVVPIEEGRLLARAIPDAEFVEVDSRNHILLEAEPGWARFQDAVLHAMRPGQGGSGVFDALSAREREVLGLMGGGLSNGDIADRLSISEKTVRNHASNIFDKLGVWSRAQAIVFARDRGFRA